MKTFEYTLNNNNYTFEFYTYSFRITYTFYDLCRGIINKFGVGITLTYESIDDESYKKKIRKSSFFNDEIVNHAMRYKKAIERNKAFL